MMDKNKYGFEPFEAVIAQMTTRYISDHVTKAELGQIINPRVIKLNLENRKGESLETEIDAPRLATLLNAGRDWYKGSGREHDGELMVDFDGMKYIKTGPVVFYQFLADLYIALPSAEQ